MAAGSAPATARSTTPPDGSGKARRPRTCRCRTTASSPTPRSRWAEAMSGHSTYEPKTGFERWLDMRLPILRMAHDTALAFPTPKNLNYWWTFGGVLALCLGIQIVTGIVLAMHYVPH